METDEGTVDLVEGDVVQRFARAALLAALMGALSFVAIPYPLSSAPVTLQLLAVFLAGLYLGPYWGGFSIVLYLAAGVAGAPVFSGGTAGIGVLLGPTGGYLVSFPIAAFVTGLLVHRGPELRNPVEVSIPVLAGALGVATLVSYAVGVAWMGYVLELSVWEAILTGAVVFAPWELLEIAAAIGVVKSGVVDPT